MEIKAEIVCRINFIFNCGVIFIEEYFFGQAADESAIKLRLLKRYKNGGIDSRRRL